MGNYANLLGDRKAMAKRIITEKTLLALSAGCFLMLAVPALVSNLIGAFLSWLALCLLIRQLPCSGKWLKKHALRRESLCAAIVLSSAFGCVFYETWLNSSNVSQIASLLRLPSGALVLLAAALLTLLSVPSISFLISYYWDALKRQAPTPLEPKRGAFGTKAAGLILTGIFVVGMLAILRANYYYNDDLERAAHGYKQWDVFSRYLYVALSSWLHMDSYLTDIAPLPQLTAAVLLAISGIALLSVVYDRRQFSLWEILAVVPLGLNPYFLECLSYRFDAPYMAVSILCAILPFLFRRSHPIAYVLAAALGSIGVCISYQASSGIFPMVAILLAFLMWTKRRPGKEVTVFLLRSAAGYFLGLVYFRIALMRPAVSYVVSSLAPIQRLIPSAVQSLGQYYRLVVSDFKDLWLLLAAAVAVTCLTASIRRSQRGKWLTAVVSVAVLALMGLVCFGLYPALAVPLYEPRAMYGFGVLLALLGIVSVEGAAELGIKLPALVLSWVFFVFSFTYGNALDVQARYSDFRISQVISGLNRLDAFSSDNPVTVQISGNTAMSPVLQNMPQDYNMLNRLVPKSFGDATEWAHYGFYYYYDLKNVVWDPSQDLTQMDLPLLEDTMYYRLYGDEAHVLVVLK